MSASDTKLIERLRNPANLGEQLESEAELTRLLKLDAELSAANAKLKYWQELAVANRKVAEDNQTRLAAVTKRRDECSNGWDEALAQRDKAVADADHFFACWQDTLEQRDKLAVALKWLDAAGNLGLDKHARIREALKECGK